MRGSNPGLGRHGGWARRSSTTSGGSARHRAPRRPPADHQHQHVALLRKAQEALGRARTAALADGRSLSEEFVWPTCSSRAALEEITEANTRRCARAYLRAVLYWKIDSSDEGFFDVIVVAQVTPVRSGVPPPRLGRRVGCTLGPIRSRTCRAIAVGGRRRASRPRDRCPRRLMGRAIDATGFSSSCSIAAAPAVWSPRAGQENLRRVGAPRARGSRTSNG